MEIDTTQTKLTELRNQGFRPGVICCFLHEKNILLLYKQEYKLWMLPQGGIEPGETPEEAVTREMAAELGQNFMQTCDPSYKLVGFDMVEFPPERCSDKKLTAAGNKEIAMVGKAYFFYIINAKEIKLALKETEFSDYFWLDFEGAQSLTVTMYQAGKRRVTRKVLDTLKELGML